FNIVGSLSMLVIEKQHDLGILKAMGASSSFIQRIFFYEGLLLSLVGVAIGMILAVLICWAQQHYKLLSLNGDTFLIDAYPVSMRTGDFVLISLTVVAIALVAAYLPARRAAMSAVLLQKE
ncbi:MAG TPA: FtsX-like permease family protein, partial [Chitinophagales bacterium]|nr:FtsX-like permease family protein [Chitinophagales bacterium]